MKKTMAFIVTSIALAVTPVVMAQQNIPPATGQNPTAGQTHTPGQAHMPGQAQGQAPAQRATPAMPANRASNSATHATMTRDLADLQTQMTEMSAEMVKIKATRDDDDRQELIEAHMIVMQESMESMQEMLTHMQQMHTSANAAVRTSSTSP